MDQIWLETLNILKTQMTRATHDAIFQNSSLVQANGTYTIKLRSNMAREWAENRLKDCVARSLQSATNQPVTIEQLVFISNEGGNGHDAENLPDEAFVRVKDRRKGKRYFIDREFVFNGFVAVLGPFATAVYNILSAHADNESQGCYLYYSTLAFEAGMCRRQVIREIKMLESHYLIEVERKKDGVRANEIYLLDVSEWKL